VARADGQPLDIGRVAVQTLLRPIDAIGSYLVGLVVSDRHRQRRQGIGDLAAGTVVTDASAPRAADPEVPEAPVIEAPVIEPPPMVAPSEPPSCPARD
jgi:uncharacterized RDD family membrane protein YckC